MADTDVTLKDIAKYTDVFYIGGTKVGALCGEAVVFPKKAPKHFFTMIKQQGALLAKGRLLGIQFDALFTDNLYLEISKNAIDTAAKLKSALKEKNYLFFTISTNQFDRSAETKRKNCKKGNMRLKYMKQADRVAFNKLGHIQMCVQVVRYNPEKDTTENGKPKDVTL